MEKVMTLREAVKQGLVKVGIEQIEYSPDFERVEIPGQKTGIMETQVFETTTDICWTLIELKRGQLALIALTPTNQILTLHGDRGARRSKKLLNNICAIWSSKELGLLSKSINPTDYKELPKSVRDLITNIWIAEYYDIQEAKNFKSLVAFVNQNGHYGKYSLASTQKGERSLSAEIRPIIYLSDDIIINVNTKKLYKNRNQFAKMKLRNIIARLEDERKITDDTIDDLKTILNNM